MYQMSLMIEFFHGFVAPHLIKRAAPKGGKPAPPPPPPPPKHSPSKNSGAGKSTKTPNSKASSPPPTKSPAKGDKSAASSAPPSEDAAAADKPQKGREPDPKNTPNPHDLPADDRKAMVDMINKERAAAGLPPLRENAALNAAAQKYADNSAAEGTFSPIGSDGSRPEDRISAEGFQGGQVAENLAGAPDIDAAHRNLMTSPGNRAHIVRLVQR